MEILKSVWWWIKVERKYTVLDLPEVKIVTLTLNKRYVLITFTETAENWNQRITLFLDDETKKHTMLLLEVMKWYRYIGVSYDKYDVTITLLKEDINQFG